MSERDLLSEVLAQLDKDGCADLSMLGSFFPEYQKTCQFEGAYIDAHHQELADLPVRDGLISDSIQGFLRPADALALYEYAYFSTGDVLELGSAWGLSTSILCRALLGSNRQGYVASVEIDPEFRRMTLANVRKKGVFAAYESVAGDAFDCIAKMLDENRKFGMCFVDHDHSHAATKSVCECLPALVVPGGYVVFHDFNDERNLTEPDVYGVAPAVFELLGKGVFSLVSIVGCCAVLRNES